MTKSEQILAWLVNTSLEGYSVEARTNAASALAAFRTAEALERIADSIAQLEMSIRSNTK